jgi:redox-sensitive bicupin YhaK (pirin superfamily)
VDAYPRSRGDLTPDASLVGRSIGNDFANVDGWNMYHGDTVPGFPSHPHRGFETITYVRSGLIDHSDSLGARARFGAGDTQWLTAGKGIVHSEMFPLLNVDDPNPLELFQIWLNLPSANKMVEPYFSMIWQDATPVLGDDTHGGRNTTITIVAGGGFGVEPSPPPPDSWASDPSADVAVWHVGLGEQGAVTIPGARNAASQRVLYVFSALNPDGTRSGGDVTVNGQRVRFGQGVALSGAEPISLESESAADVLMLQGNPINEPVATYGPFVMNTQAELEQAFADYRSTQFGGWPFGEADPTHGDRAERFAHRPDGSTERPSGSATSPH